MSVSSYATTSSPKNTSERRSGDIKVRQKHPFSMTTRMMFLYSHYAVDAYELDCETEFGLSNAHVYSSLVAF